MISRKSSFKIVLLCIKFSNDQEMVKDFKKKISEININDSVLQERILIVLNY